MTIRLVLIAHAATAATRQARFPADEPLDPAGDAKATAARGMPRRIGRAYRGPERRCRQTAAALGLDAAADPLLADLDMAAWRGRTLTDLESEQPADLRAWLTDPAAAPHGGESLLDLIERVTSWLAGLAAGPARIAAVTHPAVIRAAVLHTLNGPPAGFWRLDTVLLSQTWLTRHGGRWQLRETGHPLNPAAGDSR
jgi:broad specificity phosphatase PhoE